MAKPGSAAARQITGKGLDLSGAAMSDEKAAELQERLELRMGMRCRGCLRRIGIGIKFRSVDVRDAERPVISMAACNRVDCDFAEQAREGATCMEMVEFVWLDPAGIDARPAYGIVPSTGPDVPREDEPKAATG